MSHFCHFAMKRCPLDGLAVAVGVLLAVLGLPNGRVLPERAPDVYCFLRKR